MGVTDVYSVQLTQLDRGQKMYNTFMYQQVNAFVTTNPTNAQALAEGWRDQILPSVRAIQPAEVLTTGLIVKNLFNASDGYTLGLSLGGLYTSDRQMESTFSAIGFALNGDNPAVGNGSKRFGGVFEDYIDDGVITGSDLLTKLATLDTKFTDWVTVGLVLPSVVWKPVIVKRVRSGTPRNYSYRLPATLGETVLSTVVVALFNAVITSQVSRKIGNGV